MKRNDDLIRQLLFEYEAADDWVHILPSGGVLHASPEDMEKDYHIYLMRDEGLVASVGESTFRLTANAHDFLDAIRSESVWNDTKSAAAKVGGASLSLLGEIAKGFVRAKLTEMGVPLA